MNTYDHPIDPTTRKRTLPSLVLAAILIGAATLSACSTTEGFGEDVKHLGTNIEDSAAKNK